MAQPSQAGIRAPITDPLVMRISLMVLIVLLALPVAAEPGIAVILDSRHSGQSELAARAKRFLYVLIRQNKLADYQLSLKTMDLATAEGRRFQRDFQLTGRDLPALGYYRRQGNRIDMRNLLRAYKDPLATAEIAFRCIQVDEPNLITSTTVWTGASLATDPPGARVLEGETELGVTPCQVSLAPGRRQLSLLHPDCASESVVLNLKAGDHLERSLQLTHSPAELSIESSGPPLDLVLNGQEVGTTPLTLPVQAGQHLLEASGPGVFPLELELRAEPQTRTQAILRPTPRQVRVGLAEIDADGYLIGPSYDLLPIPSGDGVEFDDSELAQRLEARMDEADLRLVDSQAPWDCAVKLDVDAWETSVTVQLTILDRAGETMQTLSAQRGMPWLTFNAQGAARKRALQMIDELTDGAASWIASNVQPTPLTAEEQAESLELRVLGPLP